MLLGKGVLKICCKFTWEHLCRSVISIKIFVSFCTNIKICLLSSGQLGIIKSKRFMDFLEISEFSQTASLKSFGNSWSNSYINFLVRIILFRFTWCEIVTEFGPKREEIYKHFVQDCKINHCTKNEVFH